MVTKNESKPNPAPAPIDGATVAAVLVQVKATEHLTALAREGFVTEARLYRMVGGLEGRSYPPQWRTRKSEGPSLPGGARLWLGGIVEQGPGDIPLEAVNATGGEWFRELTPEEAETAVSDRMAARFIAEAQTPALHAEGILESVRGVAAGRVVAVEKAERALEEAKRQAADGVEQVARASRDLEAKKDALAVWIERSGRSEAAILEGVALLRKKPEPEAPFVPRHLAPGDDEHALNRKEQLRRENSRVAVAASVGGA